MLQRVKLPRKGCLPLLLQLLRHLLPKLSSSLQKGIPLIPLRGALHLIRTKGRVQSELSQIPRSPSHRLILIEGRILLILSPSRGSKVFVPNWKVTTGDSISNPRVAFQVASRSILPTDAGLHLGKDSKTLDL